MATLSSLMEAPTLVEFCEQVRDSEDPRNRYEVRAYDLELDLDGALKMNGKAVHGQFQLADEAGADLARLAVIPTPYFHDCDPELRALSFNRRLRQKVPGEQILQAVLRDQIVDRILNGNLLPVPRWPILDSISNAIPENVSRDDLRVVTHRWNGQFDVSVIAPNLTCEAREGDVVAFGVNVSEGRDGAIQVQGSSFRCWCSNGAVNRICDGRAHRLRRPINRPDRQQQFLRKLGSFAREAWHQWAGNAERLVGLKEVALDSRQCSTLASRLREAPFLLSLGVVNRVLEQLRAETCGHQESATLYDLWNAMTYLGTHGRGLSSTYLSRLRLGAGEFTRSESRFCKYCRQLLRE